MPSQLEQKAFFANLTPSIWRISSSVRITSPNMTPQFEQKAFFAKFEFVGLFAG
jgi:hypothetical protein